MKRISIIALYRRRRGGLALALLLALLAVAAGVGLLGVAGWFLAGAALAGASIDFNLFAPSALVRGLSFLRIGARYAERLVGHGATLHLLADLRGAVFGALARLTPRQLARFRGGDLVTRLTSDVDALDTVFLFVLAPVATALLGGLAVALVVAFSLPSAGLILLLSLLSACLVLPIGLAIASRRSGVQARQSAADLRTAVLDAVEGHADIEAMGARAAVLEHADRLCGEAGQARQTQVLLAAHGQWILQAAAGLAVLAVLWTGLPAIAAARLTGPYLAGLLLATLGIFEVAGPVMRGAARWGAARAAARRMSDLLGSEPDLQDPERPLPVPESGELAMRGVRYAYPQTADDPAAWVLDGVDFTLRPGERVGIVGASGVGKSTLLHLLLRLDDPGAGEVSYGGCDLRRCAQADVQRRIALLSQDAPVFLGTVRSNLLIGDAEADDAALWSALRAARLDTFVRGLPRGLDSWVGETGAALSAGQARRLCLARALLAPAAVLLLDEPTAGLDAQTEADFLSDLPRALSGRAAVLVTHAALPPGATHRQLHMREGRLETLAAAVQTM
ncbi:MAG: thiol reductant ABC exporter subunit CydC [Bordetella sp.]|uniref:thiol reductant ABC exporter subunit CydC n=1 Tax=Bordetella sp. TaxID=28081 RepID=UPI003F7B9115